jgi:hypothetical protein
MVVPPIQSDGKVNSRPWPPENLVQIVRVSLLIIWNFGESCRVESSWNRYAGLMENRAWHERTEQGSHIVGPLFQENDHSQHSLVRIISFPTCQRFGTCGKPGWAGHSGVERTWV